MSTIYLHIGLPKTGTTFLQQDVFPLLPIEYLDRPKSDSIEREFQWSGVFAEFFMRSPMIWKDLGADLISELLTERDTLVSDERVALYQDPVHLREHLKALREVIDRRVRVIATVRNQADRLASSYAQLSDRRPGASQADFEAWTRRVLDPRRDYYLSGITFDYNRLLAALNDAVGVRNVLILPYELMKEDLAAFLKPMYEFMGISEIQVPSLPRRNVRSAGQDTWTIRKSAPLYIKLPRLLRKIGFQRRIEIQRIDLSREKQISLTPDLRREIMSVYEVSNGKLAEAIGMDLSRYGYCREGGGSRENFVSTTRSQARGDHAHADVSQRKRL